MPYPTKLDDYPENVRKIITQQGGWKPKDLSFLKVELADIGSAPKPRPTIIKNK